MIAKPRNRPGAQPPPAEQGKPQLENRARQASGRAEAALQARRGGPRNQAEVLRVDPAPPQMGGAGMPQLPPMLQEAVAAGRLTPEAAMQRGMANRPAFAARVRQAGGMPAPAEAKPMAPPELERQGPPMGGMFDPRMIEQLRQVTPEQVQQMIGRGMPVAGGGVGMAPGTGGVNLPGMNPDQMQQIRQAMAQAQAQAGGQGAGMSPVGIATGGGFQAPPPAGLGRMFQGGGGLQGAGSNPQMDQLRQRMAQMYVQGGVFAPPSTGGARGSY